MASTVHSFTSVRYQWLAAGVILLATLLRLPWLGMQSIAFDESFSLTVSQSNLLTLFHAILSDGVHPPIFYVIHKGALLIWGITEFGQRFSPAVFSILSVALCYRIGWMFFNQSVGFISALLLALNPLHIWFAQEARMYSLLGALTIVSMLAFWQALQNNRFRDWAILAFVNGFIFVLHYFGLLIPIIQFVFISATLQRNHKNLRTWTIVQVLAFLPLLPWLVATSMRDAQAFGIGFLVQPNILDLLITFWNLVLGSNNTLWAIIVISVIIIGLSLVIAFRPLRPHRVRLKQARLLVTLWLVLPPLFTWLISQRRSFYADRYLSFVIPGLVLLLAFGISRIKKSYWRFLLLISLVMMSGLGVWTTYFDPAYQKDNWRGVATYIAHQEKANDVILLYSTHIKFPFDYYFNGDSPLKPISLNLEQFPIEPLVDDHQRAWLVYPYTRRPTHYPMQPLMSQGYWYNDPDRNQKLVTWLEAHSDSIVNYKHFQGIEMWLIDFEVEQ